jgi:inhibitor of growth protein 3
MPPRTAHTSSGAAPNTPYSLSLLSEYTHTLDSLPLDLSRNFADLRELDAVLSSSMTSITSKIHKLIKMIEECSSQKDERLWLLSEIAEEATRLKLGGEDKIRVACQAADSLKGHTAHMRSLLEHLPGFDAAAIVRRRTTYPHIAPRSFMPVAGMEGGRRRRGGFGSLLASGVESPTKRKRVVRDDDGEVHRTPRKDKVAEPSRHRNTGGRTKKCVNVKFPSSL